MSEGGEESLEEKVFKSLSNEKRRQLIRYLGERGVARFNEIKKDIDFEDGASLTYHLGSLEPLVTQSEVGYRLSPAGRDAYALMRKISSVSESTIALVSARKEITVMIVVNAILWAAAILSVRLNEGNLQGMTLYSFSALWFVSNIALYSIAKRIGYTAK
jgi:DNA-binding HxlR family transcriptional regulator